MFHCLKKKKMEERSYSGQGVEGRGVGGGGESIREFCASKAQQQKQKKKKTQPSISKVSILL